MDSQVVCDQTLSVLLVAATHFKLKLYLQRGLSHQCHLRALKVYTAIFRRVLLILTLLYVALAVLPVHTEQFLTHSSAMQGRFIGIAPNIRTASQSAS